MSSIAEKLLGLKNANYCETEILTLPDGIQVILSSLTGEDDRDIADYLINFMGKSLGHYTKLETIAYAIKWLKLPDGSIIDLRKMPYIETGESLENGTPVKKRRNIFMRDIINTWPDAIIDTLYGKYAFLMEKMDKSIQKGIKVEFGDSTLQIKINSLIDELRELVLQADGRDLVIDDEIKKYFGLINKEQRGDTLLQAFVKNPSKIPVKNIEEEVPKGIRK